MTLLLQCPQVIRDSLATDSWSSLRLHKLSGGYLLPTDSNPNVLNRYQRQPSRRLRLQNFARRWGIQSEAIELPWPNGTDTLIAARVYNDNLICWTEKVAYKFPLTELSIRRMEHAKQSRQRLSLSPLSRFLFPAEIFKTKNSFYRKSPLGDLVPLPPAGVVNTDGFISSFISTGLAHCQSFQHGDLHINNVLIHPDSGLGLIDHDEFTDKGTPIVDLLCFAVHYTGFYVLKDYCKALQMALSDPEALHRVVADSGLKSCAHLLKQHHSKDILPAFIENRRYWIRNNSPEPKFVKQVKTLLAKYD